MGGQTTGTVGGRPEEVEVSTIIWIEPTGETKTEQFALSVVPTLEKMQEFVDGYIERVNVLFNGDACDMIVNEEGLIKNLPVNWKATALYGAHSIVNMGQLPATPICGRAILLVGARLE